MTAFVSFPVESFDPFAFSAFQAVEAFSLPNAYALMWASQLAYQTQDAAALEDVIEAWGFGALQTFVRSGRSALTSGFYGSRSDAVILAFAGTDPGIWQTVETDGKFLLDPATNVHTGFQEAFSIAEPDVRAAIAEAEQTQRPLFVAGHSLGSALAALAGRFAAESGVVPMAIYTFGMPRTGGEIFASDYSRALGERTYRLVHGDDIVPCVPMPSVGFHHVGRMLQTPPETKFDPAAPLSPVGLDEPRLPSWRAGLSDYVSGLLSGHLLGRPGPMGGLMGEAIAALPPDIRHHLQDWYLDLLH